MWDGTETRKQNGHNIMKTYIDRYQLLVMGTTHRARLAIVPDRCTTVWPHWSSAIPSYPHLRALRQRRHQFECGAPCNESHWTMQLIHFRGRAWWRGINVVDIVTMEKDESPHRKCGAFLGSPTMTTSIHSPPIQPNAGWPSNKGDASKCGK